MSYIRSFGAGLPLKDIRQIIEEDSFQDNWNWFNHIFLFLQQNKKVWKAILFYWNKIIQLTYQSATYKSRFIE